MYCIHQEGAVGDLLSIHHAKGIEASGIARGRTAVERRRADVWQQDGKEKVEDRGKPQRGNPKAAIEVIGSPARNSDSGPADQGHVGLDHE